MKDKKTTPAPEASVSDSFGKKGVSRKLRFGSVAMATTAIVVVVVVLLNIVMKTLESHYPISIDLTSEGTYSLSEESLTLARNLENDTKVVVFLSESVFTADNYTSFSEFLEYAESYYGQYGYYTQFSEHFTTVLEQFYHTLKTYRAESHGKFDFTFVDLDAAPTLAAAYAEYEPEVGDILFVSGDRHQMTTIYSIMSHQMNSTSMELEFNSEVEREMASKVNLVSSSASKKASIIVGCGEDQEVMSQLVKLLPLNGCLVTTVDIATAATPDEDTDVFIIPAASKDFTVAQVATLRKWIENDMKREKDLLVFTSYARPLPNLYEFLGDEYGIVVTDNAVYETDTNKQCVTMENEYGLNNYGTVAETEFTSDTKDNRVLMPRANALTLLLPEDNDGEFSKPIVTSSDTARLLPMAKVREMEVAGEITAPDESTLLEAESYPIVTAAYTTIEEYNNPDQKLYTTDVMVFGSAAFMKSDAMNNAAAYNEDVFLSVFRGLTGLETTLTISSREMTNDTFTFETRTPQIIFGHLFVWVLPVVMLVGALVVFVRRRTL